MEDIKCPYCGNEFEVNHDDGVGYTDGETHTQYCDSCGKDFECKTTVMFMYETFCNEGDHELDHHETDRAHHYQCNRCDYSKCELK